MQCGVGPTRRRRGQPAILASIMLAIGLAAAAATFAALAGVPMPGRAGDLDDRDVRAATAVLFSAAGRRKEHVARAPQCSALKPPGSVSVPCLDIPQCGSAIPPATVSNFTVMGTGADGAADPPVAAEETHASICWSAEGIQVNSPRVHGTRVAARGKERAGYAQRSRRTQRLHCLNCSDPRAWDRSRTGGLQALSRAVHRTG